MVSSRLLRKSEKSSPSLVLRNSTPWFFAAICFLWASFLTVAMLSNEQSLRSRSRADETRGGRESDERIGEERKEKKKRFRLWHRNTIVGKKKTTTTKTSGGPGGLEVRWQERTEDMD